MQRQGRAGIAMGQHQQRVTADGDFCTLGRRHFITAYFGQPLGLTGRVKGDGPHGLIVQRIEKTQTVKTHAPLQSGLGLHHHGATCQPQHQYRPETHHRGSPAMARGLKSAVPEAFAKSSA